MNERVGVIGASGYSGIELTRILAGHPGVRLILASSDRWAGERVEEASRIAGRELRYVDLAQAERLAAECDVLFLATPADASLRLAPALLEQGCRVIDLSGAFRIDDSAAFERFYGLTASNLQSSAVYGLPELFRNRVHGARLVANPGCYPTAASLALAPLLREELLEPDLIVNAASGVTGAGRTAKEDFSFAEVAEDFRAYKVLRHQHTPEIEQTLSGCAGSAVNVTFTPHLLPIRRGILCTSYGRLRRKATSEELRALLEEAWHDEPFVDVAPSPDQVSLHRVVGTNRCLVGVACEPEVGGRVVVVSAIDNLVKGAAGQAVQNLNLLLGFDESTGLSGLRGFHP
ncbi:N-acetyl-gamma-glutamyl-phosphate reductase [Vulgatibacter incomptus]|uniref:N-acetyl-gamma-glutamyl-phosphate reductase n=1 Tax=Vulgatibacter incomptus TaxID=1391653 RepID=A0A0K1PA50_9BACT|nr:N-acetyl-gamma-glutamyl-phosphate reductase [Vulgatibacter incomptus]AKU90413.1 N-acetyl-gamma-glutamyl-phosphate reductase [Vulgatibacter incomptus]